MTPSRTILFSDVIPLRSVVFGGAPSTPLEIVRSGSNIVLRHEWTDVRRAIHMNMKTHPKRRRAEFARTFHRSLGRRDAGHRNRALLAGCIESVSGAVWAADKGPAALGGADDSRANSRRHRAAKARRRCSVY